MTDRPEGEAPHLPFPGPHWRAGPAAHEPDAPAPLRLRLRPGNFSVELTQSGIVFGRHSAADVRLPLPDVSRRHCRFDCDGGRWRVTDLYSLNGVYVNGAPVQRAELNHHDTVRIGGFTFEVDLHAGERTVGLGDEPSSHVLRSIAGALPPADEGPRRRAS